MATGKVKAGDVFNNWTVLNQALQQSSKSTRELLEERLAQKPLEKELSELW